MVILGLEILAGTYVAKGFSARFKAPGKQQNLIAALSAEKPSLPGTASAVMPGQEKETVHYLKASTLSIGMFGLGYFYPPFQIPALILASYATVPILLETRKSLAKREFKNDLLNSLVSIGCFSLGNYFTAGFAAWFYHFGGKMMIKTQNHSQDVLTGIFGQQPRTAWIVVGNTETEVPLESVHIDDWVVVGVGQVVPIDGEIVEGMAMIDEHVLTGESMPVEKGVGSQVFASTLMLSGKIWVKVERTGLDTNIARITGILTDTMDFKTGLQTRAEKLTDNIAKPLLSVGAIFIPIVGVPAAMTILYSSPGSDIKVLTSLQTLSHLTQAYRQGVLVKDGRALESLLKVDTVLFDKTGTLTSAQPEIGRIIGCDDFQERDILMHAAAAEYKLTHPIALAILAKAAEWELDLPEVENTSYIMSYGISVDLDGKAVKVGSTRFMDAEDIAIPAVIQEAQAHCDRQGYSLVILAVDRVIKGAIEIHPRIRPEAREVIRQLREQGVKYMAIVSGDRKQPTQKLAEILGMDGCFHDFLPQDKAALIERLQQEGRHVCFVGDGINDTIAMKKANVSVSMQGATSIATDTAQVVLMDSGITHLPYLFEISKRLDIKVKQTLLICGGYGVTNLLGAILFQAPLRFSFAIGVVEYTAGILNARVPKI